MNAKEIIERLEKEFPGKRIVKLPEDNPTEIICEIEPTLDHPDYSVAIAYVDTSRPHLHQETIETYVIEEGSVELHMGIITKELHKGFSYTIICGWVHWIEKGNGARVRIESTPGWRENDHILQGQ